MRPTLFLVVLMSMLLLIHGAFAEESEPRTSDVETPGQALKKSQRPNADRTRDATQMRFEGGVLVVTMPVNDLDESLPIASTTEFEEKGYEVVRSDEVEVLVDSVGKIYQDRNYQGIIPGIRERFDERKKPTSSKRISVLWVGFQPMAGVSRVFWQLSENSPLYEGNRVDELTLEVFFPGARMKDASVGRPLLTTSFGGPVDSIDGASVRGGTRFIVKLKQAANYLYRYEAPFLYLDFER